MSVFLDNNNLLDWNRQQANNRHLLLYPLKRPRQQPARFDVTCLTLNHLWNASNNHVTNLTWFIILHDKFKWSQKVLLKMKVLQFALFQKFQWQLFQWVNSEERNLLWIVASYNVEMISKNLPYSWPFKSNTLHVVITYFDQLIKAKHSMIDWESIL